jgi:hypothetical protein
MVRDEEPRDDPRGEHGGDTGKTDMKGKGPQAEKGDQRRDKPVHGGPTRPGAQNRGTRSGSDSDDNKPSTAG